MPETTDGHGPTPQRNRMRDVARAFMTRAKAALLLLWAIVRPPIFTALQIFAALILIFEEWGWQPLMDALTWLKRFRWWALIEQKIASLPPYGALAVFAVPVIFLAPVKFLALYLTAQGHFAWGLALFIGAKLASTAVVARIFVLTKPQLMQIPLFKRAYDTLMPWQAAMFAVIRQSFAWRYGRMLKTAIRLEAKQAYARWWPVLASFANKLRPWAQSLRVRLKDYVSRTFGS